MKSGAENPSLGLGGAADRRTVDEGTRDATVQAAPSTSAAIISGIMRPELVRTGGVLGSKAGAFHIDGLETSLFQKGRRAEFLLFKEFTANGHSLRFPSYPWLLRHCPIAWCTRICARPSVPHLGNWIARERHGRGRADVPHAREVKSVHCRRR